jgi:hypothetical protein
MGEALGEQSLWVDSSLNRAGEVTSGLPPGRDEHPQGPIGVEWVPLSVE